MYLRNVPTFQHPASPVSAFISHFHGKHAVPNLKVLQMPRLKRPAGNGTSFANRHDRMNSHDARPDHPVPNKIPLQDTRIWFLAATVRGDAFFYVQSTSMEHVNLSSIRNVYIDALLCRALEINKVQNLDDLTAKYCDGL
ncbi:hypothetical protein PGQ11_002665 [Apiospora arundinis]|uniref:Uncharacterized protein n=1 Tax=Apiospora arundinis TaxID=335852 RepID=A0ABR2JIX3_9PEZI